MVSSVDELMTHDSVTTVPVETPAGVVELLAPAVIVDGARTRPRSVPSLGQRDQALRQEFAPALALK